MPIRERDHLIESLNSAMSTMLRRADFTGQPASLMTPIPMRGVKTRDDHTSCTDHRHGIVEKAQRSGEVFTAKADGTRFHADEHTSLTIALWLLLKPKPVMTLAAK